MVETLIQERFLDLRDRFSDRKSIEMTATELSHELAQDIDSPQVERVLSRFGFPFSDGNGHPRRRPK